MDAHFLSEAVKSEQNQNISVIIDLFKRLAPNDNNEIADRIRTLENLHRPSKNPIEQYADEFIFQIPEHTFDDMTARLQNTPLQQYVHYRDVHNILYENTNVPCFNMPDPVQVAEAARNRHILEHPEGAPELRQQTYDDALRAQQRVNTAALAEPPVWQLLQRQGPNDIRQEDSLLSFQDTHRKHPHWYKIVRNLKTHGETHGYTLQHYKRCLDRFIGYFSPQLAPVTDNLEAIDLAKFLLRLTMPEPTKDLLTNQMKTLARQPNTPIRYVLNELHAIAKIYYHDKEPAEAAVLTNRFMIQGLCNFTTGQTRQTLVSSIEFAQAYDKPLDWERLLESITYSERTHGFPQQILSFNPQSTNALSVFHNHLLPISIPEIPVPQPVFEPFMPLYDDTDDSTKTNHSRNSFAPTPVSMPRRPQPVHQIQQPFQNYIPPIQPQNHIPQPQQQPIVPQFQQQPLVPQPQQPAQPQQQQQPLQLAQQSPRAHSTPRHQISPPNAHHSRTPVKNPNKPRERESREIPRRSSRPVKPRTLNYNINTTISTQSRSPSNDRSSNYSQRSRTYSQSPRSTPPRSPSPYRPPYQSSSNRQSQNSSSRRNNHATSPKPSGQYHRNDSSSRSKPSSYHSNSKQNYSSSRNNYSSSRQNYNSRTPSPHRSSQNYRSNRNNYSRDNRTPQRTPSPYHSKSSNNYHRSYQTRPYSPQNHSKNYQKSPNNSRTNSPAGRSDYPGYLPGVNCSKNYLPWTTKHCKKCNTYNEHHEHLCPTYKRFNENKCTLCYKSFHLPSECHLARRSQSPSRPQKQNTHHLNS
jgi:hypothetical protein